MKNTFTFLPKFGTNLLALPILGHLYLQQCYNKFTTYYEKFQVFLKLMDNRYEIYIIHPYI